MLGDLKSNVQPESTQSEVKGAGMPDQPYVSWRALASGYFSLSCAECLANETSVMMPADDNSRLTYSGVEDFNPSS